MNSSVSISPWYILNKTWSFWSSPHCEKCYFNVTLCIVIMGIFWISDGYHFCKHKQKKNQRCKKKCPSFRA